MSSNHSRTKNSLYNVLTSIGGQLLKALLQFATRTVFIITLGKAYLGINGLFSDILTMLSLTELGIDTAISYQLYQPLAEQDDKRVRVLMKFYKQAYGIIGTVILIIGLCLIPLLPILIHDYESLASLGINAVLVFLLYLFQSVSSYWFFAYRSAVIKANQRTYILELADYAITIATNIIQILILIFLRSFLLYTATVIVFNVFKNFINARIAVNDAPQFFEYEPDSLSKSEIVDLFKDCGALFVYKVNGVVLKATDNLVLSSFIGLAIVGVYSNYLLFFNTIKSFLNQFYNAIKASMGNLFATSSIEKKYRFFKIMNYLTIILYGTAAIGIAACGNELITVWVGADYTIPQPFPALIGVEILFNGLKMNLGQIRNISGAFRQMWLRPVLGAIINLGVSIWLVHVCGIYGVIIGTITADLFTNFLVDPRIIHKYSFDNCYPVREYYKRNLQYILLLLIAGFFNIWICNHLMIKRGWFSVFFHIIFVSLSVPVMYLLIYHNTEECKYLLSLGKKAWMKIKQRRRGPNLN